MRGRLQRVPLLFASAGLPFFGHWFAPALRPACTGRLRRWVMLTGERGYVVWGVVVWGWEGVQEFGEGWRGGGLILASASWYGMEKTAPYSAGRVPGSAQLCSGLRFRRWRLDLWSGLRWRVCSLVATAFCSCAWACSSAGGLLSAVRQWSLVFKSYVLVCVLAVRAG